ncbi:Fc receptor-like protein 4 isoform X3 [Cebus imitator]|uniref:Fc receptor-like protein 4 isoform X3 n=1 Tax=Cebus imitator TaxID=2715852 RepID=UPI00080A4893|nr:Fc receptor-like protein 4 isoform X3 [Cebus imitator]
MVNLQDKLPLGFPEQVPMLLWPLMLVLAPVNGQLASLILQAPVSVFEGDSVVLRCRAKVEITLNTIYKDDNILAFLNKSSDFRIHHASLKNNGAYHCTGFNRSNFPVSSNIVKIQVQELFSRPVLRASSSQPVNGSLVTLTCETQLSLERSDVQLQFRFFRDGQTLGLGWTNSSKFQITAMRSEDSGSFWCEIDTAAHTVKKESLRSQIRVQKPVPLPQILTESSSITPGWCNLTVKCRVLGTTEDLNVIWETQGLPRELEQRGTLGPAPNSWTLAVSLSPSQRNASLTCVVSNNVDQKTATKDLGEVCWAQKSVQQERFICFPFHFSNSTSFMQRRSLLNSLPSAGVAKCDLGNLGWPALSLQISSFSDHLEQASMLLWTSLLVLAPVCGQSAAAHKPVISLHPPWTTVFKGDRVALTCNGFHFNATEKTKWHRLNGRGETSTLTPGNTLEVWQSGNYRCQAEGSPQSDPVRLVFSSVSLILQAPYSVFEGDTLVLRCNKRRNEKLTAVKYTWNEKTLFKSNKSSNLLIPQASSNNSGNYQCFGYGDKNVFKSNNKIIKIKELFPHPELKVTDSQPTEGSSINLSCETQLPPERSDTPLHFIFFRDDRVILSNWSKSPELQIPTIWRENSGSYWCGAETVIGSVHKRSPSLQIHVQRIPVSGVLLESQPSGGQAVEGETLVLVCSMAEGTGDTTFSWHREDTQECLGKKIQRSPRAELELPAIRESHAGGYYCTADNSYGPVQSVVLNVTVRVTPGNRDGLVTAGAIGGLLGALLLAVVLLFHCWRQRKPGDRFLGDETRIPPTLAPGESSYSICPAQVELQRLYVDVHPKEEDLIYPEIQIIRLGEEGEANISGTLLEDKDVSVVYAEVKAQHPDNSAGKVCSKDEECHENEKLGECPT